MKEKASLEERKGIINPWLEFLINPLGKEVSESMRTDEELREAVNLLRQLNDDEEVSEIYEREEWDRFVSETERETFIDIGKEQGRNQEKIDVILNMHENKLPIEMISKITKITVEEVENIINSKRMKYGDTHQKHLKEK